jgi:hypothetical protein
VPQPITTVALIHSFALGPDNPHTGAPQTLPSVYPAGLLALVRCARGPDSAQPPVGGELLGRAEAAVRVAQLRREKGQGSLLA